MHEMRHPGAIPYGVIKGLVFIWWIKTKINI